MGTHHSTTPPQSGGLGLPPRFLPVKYYSMTCLKHIWKTLDAWPHLDIIECLQYALFRGKTGSHLSRNNILPGRRWTLPDYNRLVSNVGVNRISLYVIVHMPVRVIRRKEVGKAY